jgi:hypothetical protein
MRSWTWLLVVIAPHITGHRKVVADRKAGNLAGGIAGRITDLGAIAPVGRGASPSASPTLSEGVRKP